MSNLVAIDEHVMELLQKIKKIFDFNTLYLFPQQHFIKAYAVKSSYFDTSNLLLLFVPLVMTHPVQGPAIVRGRALALQ